MRIILKGTNILISDLLKEYAEKKFSSLKKFIGSVERDGQFILKIEIARTSKHHRKGNNVYYVECTIKILGKTIRIEQYGDDVRRAMDIAKDKLKRAFISEVEKSRK